MLFTCITHEESEELSIIGLHHWHNLDAFAIRSLALTLIRNMRRPHGMDDNQDHGIDPHSDECLISFTFLSSSTHDRKLHMDFATHLHSKHRSTNTCNCFWLHPFCIKRLIATTHPPDRSAQGQLSPSHRQLCVHRVFSRTVLHPKAVVDKIIYLNPLMLLSRQTYFYDTFIQPLRAPGPCHRTWQHSNDSTQRHQACKTKLKSSEP